MTEAATGGKAPAFKLPRDGGGEIGLADLSGKPAVLFFYPKDDTSGCTAEALAFSELAPRFAELGVALLGLSPDSVKSHDKFKKKHDLNVPLASDEEKTTLQAYGVWTEKSMYGRKYMGVERSTFLLDADGAIVEVWRKVKVPGHAEAVLERARALVG